MLFHIEYLQVDETTLKVLENHQKKRVSTRGVSTRGYFWVYNAPLSSLPVYNLLGKLTATHLKTVLPKSLIGVAMNYTFHRWEELGDYRPTLVKTHCM